MIHEWGWQCR